MRDIGNGAASSSSRSGIRSMPARVPAAHLPKEALGPVMAALDGPPDGGYLDYLKTV